MIYSFTHRMKVKVASRLVLCALLVFIRYSSFYGQSFTISQLGGESVVRPTSICFGPDQKLYVLNLDGTILIYTIVRTGSNDYDVTATETITLVKNMQNHNDDGTVPVDSLRQATGIQVVGTPSHPVIYVSSSDPRVGGGIFTGTDTNLDTNSGTISRLSKNGGSWSKVDLVRGLPRSEEDHSTNGLFYDASTHTLYVAQGGNTNAGSPSTALAYLCEYALSGAILSIDLNALEEMPILVDTSSGAQYIYNLPTVDDPTRSNANGIDDPMAMGYNGVDMHDPFGGNDGLNQAKFIENGPVQIYAPGFRNPYDLLITQLGHMYTWDNGPNPLYGGTPSNEGLGTATNVYNSSEPGSSSMTNMDGLHKIETDFYGGHPSPIRCNPDSAGLYTRDGATGIFRTEYIEDDPATSLPYDWPPLPVDMAHPIEGDYQVAGTDDNSIYAIYKKSMNGLSEYTAMNFDSSMVGDLLCTALLGPALYRVKLNANGNIDHPDSVVILTSNLPIYPLDVISTSNGGPFPGTIWVACHLGGGPIAILEPSDFVACLGTDNNTIDEDYDGFTNADEIDNGTGPCNGLDVPSDHDGTLIGGFLVSDLNDPDDDDDGINDILDLFVWDPMNGLNTTIPIEYPLLNNDPGTGFYGLGFTGFMMNGTDDYLELWKTGENSTTSIMAGGEDGVLSLIGVDQGDALNAFDDQHNAFQFGFAIDSTDAPFLAEAQIAGPVFPDTIQNFQSMGMYIGTGDQNNYVKIVINANGGTPGIAVVVENNGSSSSIQYAVSGIGSESNVRLALLVNPVNGFVIPQYATDLDDLQDLSDGFYIQGPLLATLKGPQAVAMGVISTARGSTNRFEVTWSHLSVDEAPERSGVWYTLQDGSGCQPENMSGECCQSRHEAAYIQSGDKFYLLGGREHSSNVNIYNPATDTWTIGAAPDILLHHFQAIDYYGLIVAAGAFTGDFPFETPVTRLIVYNPMTNTWHNGPTIPSARRRGSAATVLKNDTLYMIGGLTNGHVGGSVNWFDRFDFRTNTWGILTNAPNQRDHFHAALKDDKIYAAAGRRTTIGNLFLDTEPTVDVFDISTGTWDAVAAALPTKRAGNTVAVMGDELLVIGGERESGSAKKATEALDLSAETWRTLDSLNIGRHGTQAIINNEGIYVASGATMQGGNSTTRTTEAFFFYGQTDPILTPTDASELAGVDHDFDEVPIEESASFDLYLHNANGNQAILLKNMTMFDSTIFIVDTSLSFPRFLKPGDSLRIPIVFSPTIMQPYSDTLYLQHTGSNAPTKKIVLLGEGGYNWLGDVRAYVDSSATGTGLGISWDDAFPTVQEALLRSTEYPQITEVWIAKGTYSPANVRTSSFVLRDSLMLYGGFHGTEILLSQRDIDDFPVVLSGDIGTQDDSTDNVFHVVMMTGTADTATLDGVTIEEGLANGYTDFDKQGAGVLNFGNLIIRNSTIRHCTSINAGSALVNSGMSAFLLLDNVGFHGNSDPHLVNKEGALLNWEGNLNLLQQE